MNLQVSQNIPDILEELLQEHGSPAVSLYLSTHKDWTETGHDKIRLKNLVRDSVTMLTDLGIRTAEARKMLLPVMESLEDESFWRERAEGLGLFISPERK